MLLDQLKDFEWMNDPFDVFFDDKGMVVTSREQTDFWQSLNHNVQIDNGHFFFTRKITDFSFTVKWSFETNGQFDQCGIMVRIDNRNWLKAGIMFEDNQHPKLSTCAVNRGYADLAAQDIPFGTKEVWFKVKRVNGDYLIYFSIDGSKFQQIRMLHFINDMTEVKVGPYICSPHKKSFTATLNEFYFG